MNESLRSRLAQHKERPISEQLQHRWIKQLASAVAWLEQLDYFHGDMRPANILLDVAGNVMLCDFGNATRRGEELPGATDPFYRLLPGMEKPSRWLRKRAIRNGLVHLHHQDGPPAS